MLDARLRGDASGLWLEGVYRSNAFGRVFMTIWFAFLLILLPFFLVAGTISLLAGDLGGLGFVFGPPLMLAFGIGFVHWGQTSWADDKRMIEEFIRRNFR